MSSNAAGAVSAIRDEVWKILEPYLPFLADVTSYSAGAVGIQPHDESAAHGQTYARAAGFRVGVGDVVRCQRLVGTPDTPGEIVVLDIVLSSTAGEAVVGAADLVSSYSLSTHNHDATYVNEAGDTMAGTLTVGGFITANGGVIIGTGDILDFGNGINLSRISGATLTNNGTFAITNGDLSMTGSAVIGGILDHNGTALGFFNAANAAKHTVTGARGSNAALTSLLTALTNYGLVTNSTTT